MHIVACHDERDELSMSCLYVLFVKYETTNTLLKAIYQIEECILEKKKYRKLFFVC